MTLLGGREVFEAGLTQWRLLAGRLRARFVFEGFAPGAAFTQRIADAADKANHHPDLTVAYGRVDVSLVTHDAGGVTERDVALAREISAIAAEEGVSVRPETLLGVQWGLDTADPGRISPFWRALLGDEDEQEVVRDAVGDAPPLWFQDSEPRPGVDRGHLDVYLPDEAVAPRLAAVLDAGGELLTADFAPAWWVLGDSDGNRACICSWHEPGDDFAYAADVRAVLDAR